jgi:phosphopantetheinyl transferase
MAVDLWLLDTQTQVANTLYNKVGYLLPQKERDRSSRMLRAEHQRRATLTRIFVRTVLSHYGEVPPQAWQFSAQHYGKPVIAGPDSSLQFNLSHSDDRVAVAISLSSPVGVDIEQLECGRDITGLAKRYYSEEENKLVSEGDMAKNFFYLWTLKEACTKAFGLTLDQGLARFHFQRDADAHFSLAAKPSETIGVTLLTDYLPYCMAIAEVGNHREPDVQIQEMDVTAALWLWGTGN